MSRMTADRDTFPSRCGAPMRGGKKCVLNPRHAARRHRATPRSPLEAAATPPAAARVSGWSRRWPVAQPLCAQTDPELFFSSDEDDLAAAKKICGRCPIRQACLQLALDSGDDCGVWGGMSEQERRSLR